MAIKADVLKKLIEENLIGASIKIEDTMGDGDHYKATIVYAGFAGKSRVEQHKMVYGALGEIMGGALHALSLETRAE